MGNKRLDITIIKMDYNNVGHHHLLQLLLDGVVERKANDEGDAHDEEEDGADDVRHQVQGEVAHLEYLEEGLLARPSLMTLCC